MSVLLWWAKHEPHHSHVRETGCDAHSLVCRFLAPCDRRPPLPSSLRAFPSLRTNLPVSTLSWKNYGSRQNETWKTKLFKHNFLGVRFGSFLLFQRKSYHGGIDFMSGTQSMGKLHKCLFTHLSESEIQFPSVLLQLYPLLKFPFVIQGLLILSLLTGNNHQSATNTLEELIVHRNPPGCRHFQRDDEGYKRETGSEAHSTVDTFPDIRALC